MFIAHARYGHISTSGRYHEVVGSGRVGSGHVGNLVVRVESEKMDPCTSPCLVV